MRDPDAQKGTPMLIFMIGGWCIMWQKGTPMLILGHQCYFYFAIICCIISWGPWCQIKDPDAKKMTMWFYLCWQNSDRTTTQSRSWQRHILHICRSTATMMLCESTVDDDQFIETGHTGESHTFHSSGQWSASIAAQRILHALVGNVLSLGQWTRKSLALTSVRNFCSSAWPPFW